MNTFLRLDMVVVFLNFMKIFSTLADFNLVQMVTETTRGENILDFVFLPSNHTLVKMWPFAQVCHDLVYSEVLTKPVETRQPTPPSQVLTLTGI